MFKWNLEKFKGFLLGSCIVGLLFSFGTAYADGKLTTIKVVQGGIKLFVDGKLVKPTDSDGKVVEPFIYDGTTYLPLRALSNALTNYEKEVSWNAKTSSIYVGQSPVASQTDFSELQPYNSSSSIVVTGSEAKFNILDKTVTPFNLVKGGMDQIFILQSNYSSLDGQFIVPYSTLGTGNIGVVRFFSVDKKGNESEIASFKTEAGNDAVQVHADLRGVEILKVQTYSEERYESPAFLGERGTRWKDSRDGVLYNVVLAGVKQ